MLTVGRVGAGTGCAYLTTQVAAGRDDFAQLSPAQALAYYSDVHGHGESPGRWLGRGLETLGLSGRVHPDELDNLVGKARHPHYDQLLQRRALALLDNRSLSTAQRERALQEAGRQLYLGRQFAIYESAAARAARAVEDLGADADEASKDAVRSRVLAEGDRQAVAGYELTFTPVKSVSVLAALGGAEVWQQVLDAHRAAVDAALEYVQDEAAYSRVGVNGVQQIDTRGLVIAAFEHRMSRAQDPNIHTHAVIANRVLCVDGAWRTVDGRAVYAASVGARAIYEQALETELAARLGVRFGTGERGSIREVEGVPLPLIELFSKRRAVIEQAMAGAVDGAGCADGRGGAAGGRRWLTSASAWRTLARRYALSTRERRTGSESTVEAIERWANEARTAGRAPARVVAAARTARNKAARTAARTGPRRHADRDRGQRDTDRDVIAAALGVLDQTRAVWTRHHAVLAVCRVLPPLTDPALIDTPADEVPGQGGRFAAQRERIERLASAVLAASLQLTPPDPLDVGPELRRASDGQSTYTVHADVLYATRSTMAAEERVLAALEDADAPALPAAAIGRTLARFPLGDDQDRAAHHALTSTARLVAIVGPAGSGKTYLQRAIVDAWRTGAAADRQAGPGGTTTHSAARGSAPAPEVLALAPSQIAATLLGEAIGTRAENVAKWLHEYRRATRSARAGARAGAPDQDWLLRPGQLVILDEAGMVTTRELDEIVTAVRRAGAKLLLVGDDRQLGAVGAGGMFATLAARTDAPVLSRVRRFREVDGTPREWEARASLGLRERAMGAVLEYERRGRIHAGPRERMEESAYRAWLADHLQLHGTAEGNAAGGVALLMAATEAGAAALSARARADLADRGLVERDGAPLADGNTAGVGDLIVTRLNERSIPTFTRRAAARASVSSAGVPADAADASAPGFVANRDTWRVIARSAAGDLTVTSLPAADPARDATDRACTLQLPAAYVAANVQLAYAGTIHSAQGRTVDTARGLVSDATSAEALYVMMTRGRVSNQIYVVTDDARGAEPAEAHQRWPEQHHLAVIDRILTWEARPGASASDTQREQWDASTSLQRLRAIHADLAVIVRGRAMEAVIVEHAGAEIAGRAVVDPAWGSLVRALGEAERAGWDTGALLAGAIAHRELSSAADVAAVLHWRCASILDRAPVPALGADHDGADHDADHDTERATDRASTHSALPADSPSWAARTATLIATLPADADARTRASADALTRVADLMDQRAGALAHALAEQAVRGQRGGYEDGSVPGWIRTLGPVPAANPADGSDLEPTGAATARADRRAEWLATARAVVTYLDGVGHDPAHASTIAAPPDDHAPTDLTEPDGAAPGGRAADAPGDSDPLGAAPRRGDREARELWEAARAALARHRDAMTMRAFTTERLTGWVRDVIVAETREQPAYVGHELRRLSLRARAQRTRVERLEQELTTIAGQLATAGRRRRWPRRRDTAVGAHGAGTAASAELAGLTREHERAETRLDRARTTLTALERDHDRAVGMHAHWQEWDERTADLRLRGRLAAQELSLRGVADPDTPVGVASGESGSLAPVMDIPSREHRATATTTTTTADRPTSTGRDRAAHPAATPGRERAPDPAELAAHRAVLAAAAAWFTEQAADPRTRRWSQAYLRSRGVLEAARAAGAGYAPSREGRWSLLVDHLRAHGHREEIIEAAGLGVRTRHDTLIDRFRDRVMLPVRDEQDRVLGFVGRKPPGDTNPDNPKYLNGPDTLLYRKHEVLDGLDRGAVALLRAGARPVIVEGPFDRLAVITALTAPGMITGPDATTHSAPTAEPHERLVPLAPCGTALTSDHLDVLARYTDSARLVLAFDPDEAGRRATLRAGERITARGIASWRIGVALTDTAVDPGELLIRDGAQPLAAALRNPAQITVLSLRLDERLERYRWPGLDRALPQLPIAEHAAHVAVRALVAELRRDLASGSDEQLTMIIGREVRRIAEHTGTALSELTNYAVDLLVHDDAPAAVVSARPTAGGAPVTRDRAPRGHRPGSILADQPAVDPHDVDRNIES